MPPKFIQLADFDLCQPKTGEVLVFLHHAFCPCCASSLREVQKHNNKMRFLIHGDPECEHLWLDSDGTLVGLLDFERQTWCLTLNGVVDHLGKPYQVAPDSNLTVSRLIPSTDPAVRQV